jgi:hypothetical protein
MDVEEEDDRFDYHDETPQDQDEAVGMSMPHPLKPVKLVVRQ